MSHNFKKQFGQNFLKSSKFVHKLISPLNLSDKDLVIEIGPGDGMVTKLLLDNGSRVVSVEVDYDLLANLIKRFIENPNFRIKHKDILEFDIEEELKEFDLESIKIVGSLPYNISKKIIRKFLKYSIAPNAKFKLSAMSFIVQDEVAKVYVARSPKATYLSTVASIYAEVKKLESIPAAQFIPKPKVDGGILFFKIRETPLVEQSEIPRFEKFLKACFSSSRKTLYNNLLNIKEREKVESLFKDLKIDKNARASELSIDMWIKLFKDS